jgi:hypothetical protein
MRRIFLLIAIACVIGAALYAVSYFHWVTEGKVRPGGIACSAAYLSSPFSEPSAQTLYAPIHALDRQFFRPNKWGDALEAGLFNVFIPKEATARFCGLHHRWRTNATVPVSYGTPDVANPYFAARRTKFPNAWSYLDGGCVQGMSSQTQVIVRVCGGCRTVEDNWRQAQK